MRHPYSNYYTVFNGQRRIASGPLASVALVVKAAIEGLATDPVLIFDDATGRSIDIDTRGSAQELLARFAPPKIDNEQAETAGSDFVNESEVRGRGRPRLGVVSREITLLPRHWEWLSTQPGGASVALRKLVEEARRTQGEKINRRQAQERTYHFMSAMAGDLPGFEEATRALFANDQQRFLQLIAPWPNDVRDHIIQLAFGNNSDSL